MNKIYCTYFDSNYLLQGITMIDSLRKHDSESKIVILALDEESRVFLTYHEISNSFIISTTELEIKYPMLLTAKNNRSKIEYYFTLTPSLIKYANDLYPSDEILSIYLDADLFFFDNPGELYIEMNSHSVGIIPHRFNANLAKKMNRFGKYNVGMVIFKSDSEGMRILDWWFKSCVEWCYDYVDNGKFADQGYLDCFEVLSKKVLIIDNLGANLAPWNVGNHNIEKIGVGLYVENYKLIFFHFHNIKIIFNRFLIPHIYYRARLTKTVKDNIYQVYLTSLFKFSQNLDISLNESLYIFRRRQKFIRRIYRWLIISMIFIRRDYIRINKREFEHYVGS